MKWTINSLSTLNSPEPNTAVMSNFTISDTQNGLTGSVTYSVNLLPVDVENFTPYADITQEQAIEWTQAALGEQRVIDMESEVQVHIDQQKIPTPHPTPLPWVSETVSLEPDLNSSENSEVVI
jgi:hypothetical protein